MKSLILSLMLIAAVTDAARFGFSDDEDPNDLLDAMDIDEPTPAPEPVRHEFHKVTEQRTREYSQPRAPAKPHQQPKQSAPKQHSQTKPNQQAQHKKWVAIVASVEHKVNSGRYEESLKESESLLNELKPLVKSSTDKTLLHTVARLHYNRLCAFWLSKLFVQAVMEAQNLKKYCTTELMDHASLEASAKFINTAEQHFRVMDPYSILGLDKNKGATPADAKKAYKKLALLLHPDKNYGLDEDVKKTYGDILHVVKVSFENLMKS